MMTSQHTKHVCRGEHVRCARFVRVASALPWGRSTCFARNTCLVVHARKFKFPGDSGWDPWKLKRSNHKAFNELREIELIHARWAMLGVLGLIFSDIAGQPFYPYTNPTPATVLPLAAAGLVVLAIIETYRLAYLVQEKDVDARMYPGKQFDFLGLTKERQKGRPPGIGIYSGWVGGFAGWLAGGWWFQQKDLTEMELDELKTKELKNGRLAMVSFLGCCFASFLTGKGPYTLLLQHLSDPVHNTVMQQISQ